MVARMVVHDARARRTSAVAANSILTVPARPQPFNLWLVGGLTFVGVVLLLLVIPVLRAGGAARRARATPDRPAPVVADGDSPAVLGAVSSTPAATAGSSVAPSLGLLDDARREAAPRVAPLPSSVMGATLTGPAGVYPIAPATSVRVGRDPSVSDICLTEPRVSAQHAMVRLDAGQLLVRDEGSNNGTFVSGFRIAAGVWTPVPHGTQLKFGPIEFTVRLE
jgi:hypothetical protein